MSNYIATARTNYFPVEDMSAFEVAIKPFDVTTSVNKDGLVSLFDATEEGWRDHEDKSVFEAIMPLVKEGVIVVSIEVGHEKTRYLFSQSVAYVRRGDEVTALRICSDDIYEKAAKEFGVDRAAISLAAY